MEIKNAFELSASPERAYALLLDLDEVIPCLPGATLGEERDGGARGLSVAVKLGPMRFHYDGEVRVVARDEAERQAVLEGSARETRGQGTAHATVTMTVGPSSAGSEIVSVADIQLSGRAAQMGHGIVQTVAEQLIRDMTSCLAAKLPADEPEAAAPAPPARAAASPQARPVSGLRLVLRAFGARLKRFFGRR